MHLSFSETLFTEGKNANASEVPWFFGQIISMAGLRGELMKC
jgi:hypothetical protein